MSVTITINGQEIKPENIILSKEIIELIKTLIN